jgi:hypothetical protein
LGDAKTLGGTAEVQVLGQNDEVAKVAQLHVIIRCSYQSGRKSY